MDKVFSYEKQQNQTKRNKKIKKLNNDFQSSKFRFLNEYLYSNNSLQAQEYFQNHVDDFKQYHNGYQNQVTQWPINPLQKKTNKFFRISKIKRVLVDHGCGQGVFSTMFYDQKNKKTLIFKRILSFDLVSVAPFIKQCDISKLPLKDQSIDCSLFSLSLMGTNYPDFIKEALRILRIKGYILITEVYSRFVDKEKFLQNMKRMGLKLESQKNIKGYFYFFVFKKVRVYEEAETKNLDWKNILKACIYKKRQLILNQI